jgi:hypothetical protein
VFENPKRFFRQRIGHSRRGAALDIRIDGPTKGQTKRIEYAWQRVPCGGTD